ncbi:MAG: hypothetical protein KC503_21340, partial [Myxococcales bacterium]|nr:hypothetical protein [Myxococcales bacterium]
DIHVAAFEMVEDEHGKPFVYDVNTNTNYNQGAEKAARVTSAYDRLADYLMHERDRLEAAAL